MTQIKNPFLDSFNDAFKQFSEQSNAFDFSEYLQSAQKNFDSISSANQIFAEGLQELAQRQLQIVQQNADAALTFFKEVASSKDPKEGAQKQAKFAKDSFENALTNSREMFDIAVSANQKASELLSQQASENIKNLNEKAKKPSGKKAA